VFLETYFKTTLSLLFDSVAVQNWPRNLRRILDHLFLRRSCYCVLIPDHAGWMKRFFGFGFFFPCGYNIFLRSRKEKYYRLTWSMKVSRNANMWRIITRTRQEKVAETSAHWQSWGWCPKGCVVMALRRTLLRNQEQKRAAAPGFYTAGRFKALPGTAVCSSSG